MIEPVGLTQHQLEHRYLTGRVRGRRGMLGRVVMQVEHAMPAPPPKGEERVPGKVAPPPFAHGIVYFWEDASTDDLCDLPGTIGERRQGSGVAIKACRDRLDEVESAFKELVERDASKRNEGLDFESLPISGIVNVELRDQDEIERDILDAIIAISHRAPRWDRNVLVGRVTIKDSKGVETLKSILLTL